MIDPLREEILSGTDAATYIQRTFGGRKPSCTTMARWQLRGMKGIRLESLKRGGLRLTSKEAIVRFFQRLAEATDVGTNAPAVVSAAAHHASAELVREGF